MTLRFCIDCEYCLKLNKFDNYVCMHTKALEQSPVYLVYANTSQSLLCIEFRQDKEGYCGLIGRYYECAN